MSDGYLLGADEVRRTAAAVRADEAKRPQEEQGGGGPHNIRQLRPFHKLPAVDGEQAKVHPVLGIEGFDPADLQTVCSDDDLVLARTTELDTYLANETAFFEGTLFEQEIGLGLSLAGKVYLFGSNHICVTGTKQTEDGTMYVVLDDCPTCRVRFEWLTTPADDVPDGVSLVAAYVRARRTYIAVVIDCEEA